MRHLLTVLGMVFLLASCGRPIESGAPEPAAAPPAAVSMPSCASALLAGESAVITSDGCFLVAADPVAIAPSGPVTGDLVGAWVGPGTRFCYGRTAAAQVTCVSNDTPVPVESTASPTPAEAEHLHSTGAYKPVAELVFTSRAAPAAGG